MHLVWTGVAKVLADRGIDDLRFVQEGAVAGEVFAFGISEAGNDLVLFGSDTDAAPQPDGSYAFTGTKIFTSLAPVWTQLGLHGLDTTSPDAPKMVYAFVPRSEEADGRVVTRDDWDTLGMRGTQSRTTELHGAIAPADGSCAASTPARIPTRWCSASSACSSCCSPRCTRASPGGRSTSPSRRPASAGRRRPARHTARTPTSAGGSPTWRSHTTPCRRSSRRSAATSTTASTTAARWFSLLAGVKHRAVTMAKSVVDDAILVSGGSSYFSGSELSRLYRDVIAGMFHPSDPESAHTTVATAWLGPLEST